ncbi:MAG: hypothetical protein WBD40_20890 [Tepidisphaeraceae bacterium]
MDMSKLPRLSQTNKDDAPTPIMDPATPSPPRVNDAPYDPPPREREPVDLGYSIGAEVWISVILGVVFMFIGANFARYAAARLTGGQFHTNVNWTAGDKEGTEVDYFDLQGGTAYTESGMFLFGLALVLEAASLLVVHMGAPGKRALVAFALFVTLLATAYNLLVVFKLFAAGVMPLMTVIAVAIGGYMAAYQWRMWKVVSATSDAAPRA